MNNSMLITTSIGCALVLVIAASPKLKDARTNQILLRNKETVVMEESEQYTSYPVFDQKDIEVSESVSTSESKGVSPFDDEDEEESTRSQEEVEELCHYVQEQVDGYVLSKDYIYLAEETEEGLCVFGDLRDNARYVILYGSSGNRLGVEYYKEEE